MASLLSGESAEATTGQCGQVGAGIPSTLARLGDATPSRRDFVDSLFADDAEQVAATSNAPMAPPLVTIALSEASLGGQRHLDYRDFLRTNYRAGAMVLVYCEQRDLSQPWIITVPCGYGIAAMPSEGNRHGSVRVHVAFSMPDGSEQFAEMPLELLEGMQPASVVQPPAQLQPQPRESPAGTQGRKRKALDLPEVSSDLGDMLGPPPSDVELK